MGRCRPGQLVNPECLGTRAPFTRDSWLSPRALGHKRECPGTAGRPLGFGGGPESPGTACRPRRPSDPSASGPGQQVDPTGPRALAGVAQDRRSTSRALRNKPETSGTAGRWWGPTDPSAKRPGKLFDTAGPRAQSGVTRDSWWSPRALGNGPESPKRARRPRVPSDPSAIHPGEMSKPKPRPLDAGPSAPGQLVDTACSRTRARITRGSWATPWALGHGPESPGPPGGHREASGTVPSHPGRLVDTAVPLTRAQVTRDSWSTQRDIGHGPESPGTAGRPWDLRP